jgi:uncharacterized membrane protein YozB (DUF420 family)
MFYQVIQVGILYQIILGVHNLMRWVVVILAILALVRAYLGWLRNREWTMNDRKIGVFYTAALDTQLLLGLILYFFLSPLTATAFRDLGAAMSSPAVRFFLLEHALYMILAVILAHIGSAFSRRAASDAAKHRTAAIWYTLSALAIIVGMPWGRRILPGL